MHSTTSPFTSTFLDDQRRRLLVARDRLRTQLAIASGLDTTGSDTTGSDASREQDPASIADAGADLARARAGLPFALPPATLAQGLSVGAAQALGAVDAALERLAAGNYGWDDAAGAWIPADRLRALPSARAVLSPLGEAL